MPDQLDELTFREFNNAAQGLAERDQQHSRDNWERSRMLATTLIKPHLKKDENYAANALAFGWDKNQKTKDKQRTRVMF